MKYERKIKISRREAEQINMHLHKEPTCAEECMGEDITITNTASFNNGIEMDIKCCGVQYEEDSESNTAWTEAVLFLNGHEVCCSEPSDEYLGEWVLEYDGDEYVVNVETEPLVQYYTTVMKKEYPYIVEVLEMSDSGKVAKCLCFDTDGVSHHEYPLSEIRPYTANEYWSDIAGYYNIEHVCDEDVFSESFLLHLNDLIEEYKSTVEEIEKQAEADGIDLFDVDDSVLWEHDRAEEIAGMLLDLEEIITKISSTQ